MDSFPNIVDKLEIKVLALLERKKNLSTEVDDLKAKVEHYQQQNKLLEEEVEQLKERNQILRITKGRISREERREVEVKINEIVREVDKCISQLNQ